MKFVYFPYFLNMQWQPWLGTGWLKKILKQKKYTGTVRMAPPYHNHSSYIDPIAERLRIPMNIYLATMEFPKDILKADPTKTLYESKRLL